MIREPTKPKKSSNIILYLLLAIIATVLIQCTVKSFELEKYKSTESSTSIYEEETGPVYMPIPTVQAIEETPFIPFDPNQQKFDLNVDEISANQAIPEDQLEMLPKSDLTDVSTFLPLNLLRTGNHSQLKSFDHTLKVGFLQIDWSTGYNLIHHLARSYHYKLMNIVLECMYRRKEDGINFKLYLNMGSKISGDTPLHLAVSHPNVILSCLFTETLLNYGADPHIQNLFGKTAMDIALTYKDKRRLQALSRASGVYGKELECLKCAFSGKKDPKDPIHWLLNGSMDEFLIDPESHYTIKNK